MDPRTRAWLWLGRALHLEKRPVGLLCVAYIGPCFLVTFLWLWSGLGWSPIPTGVSVAVLYLLAVAYVAFAVRRDMRRLKSAPSLSEGLSALNHDTRQRQFFSLLRHRWIDVLVLVVVVEWLIVHFA